MTFLQVTWQQQRCRLPFEVTFKGITIAGVREVPNLFVVDLEQFYRKSHFVSQQKVIRFPFPVSNNPSQTEDNSSFPRFSQHMYVNKILSREDEAAEKSAIKAGQSTIRTASSLSVREDRRTRRYALN
jgi:hypothetical protein